MSGDKLHRLAREVADLSVFLHTEMSSMPREEGSEEEMDLTEVLRLDPSTTLLRIKSSLSSLLKFKRDILLSREYSDFKTTHQYQSALQKLESEVRNHIKVQQQLKIHIETLQSRVQDSEHEAERLRKDLKHTKEPWEGSSCRREKATQESLQVRHGAGRDQSRVAEMENIVWKLEGENEAKRCELVEKSKECERLAREVQRLKSLVSHVKENVQNGCEWGKKKLLWG